MKIKKSVEKSFDEDINLFETDCRLKVTTTLRNLVSIIQEAFSAEEIAYFMFMLTDDGGEMKVEEKYLQFFAEHYSSEDFHEDDEDYKKIAEAYKALVKAYK